MALSKIKIGSNMYGWVTHCHSSMAGACLNSCEYCYVKSIEKRFNTGKFLGPIRLLENELQVNYGSGKTIFIEHTNDLFAEGVPDEFIHKILEHCCKYPYNTYVFQTKNPGRYREYLNYMPRFKSSSLVLGTTVESDTWHDVMGSAPRPIDRLLAMCGLSSCATTFVTIEPIMTFELQPMLLWMQIVNPRFINIGADSKHSHLPEPSKEDVLALIDGIKKLGIEVRQKSNLERLLT